MPSSRLPPTELVAHPYVQDLRDRIEVLELQNKRLRRELKGDVRDIPLDIRRRLTPQECDVLRMLMNRPIITGTALYHALYGHRTDSAMPRPNIVSVVIHHIRVKLANLAITVENDYGSGYYLTAESKAQIRRARH